MSTQMKGVTKTVLGLVVLMALMAVVFIFHHIHNQKKSNLNDINGTVLEIPHEINQFSLTGIDNQPFSNASLQGQWTLIFFGFTNCGLICPTTMAELAKMYRILEKNKVKPLPKVVLISVDPERDTQAKLNSYVKAYNPHFYGAFGRDEVIRKMTREMGLSYTKINLPKSMDGEESYDMQHSGAIVLFNPQGELSAFFTTPHQAKLMAKDYQLLVS